MDPKSDTQNKNYLFRVYELKQEKAEFLLCLSFIVSVTILEVNQLFFAMQNIRELLLSGKIYKYEICGF